MSRIAKSPIPVPAGVDVNISGQQISVKGAKGNLAFSIHPLIRVSHADGVMRVETTKENKQGWALAGTTRADLKPGLRARLPKWLGGVR